MIFIYIAVAFLAIMYIGSPIVVRLNMKFNTRSLPEPIAIEAMPPVVYDYFGRTAPPLMNCGFRLATYLRVPQHVPNVVAYVALWAHDTAGQMALAAVMYASASGTVKVKRHVEFMTKLASGLEILTNNSSELGVFRHTPEKDTLAVQDLEDIVALYRVHLLREATLAPQDEPRFMPEPGSEAGTFVDGIAHELRQQTDLGFFYAAGGGVYRPTSLGALVMTYKELPPFKQFRRGRMRQRAQRALLESQTCALYQPTGAPITHESPYPPATSSPLAASAEDASAFR